MKKTQVEWVRSRLKEKGEITRNECLRNFISRLSAIIYILRKEGWGFRTETRRGDFVYVVKKQPKPSQPHLL